MALTPPALTEFISSASMNRAFHVLRRNATGQGYLSCQKITQKLQLTRKFSTVGW
jgi:hypothetical protein